MDGEVRAELDRIHDEDKRQNKRLDDIEKKQGDIAELTASVREIALNGNYTREKVDNIDKRLEKIESDPVDTIKSIKETTVKSVVSFVLGLLLAGLVWLVTNHGGI